MSRILALLLLRSRLPLRVSTVCVALAAGASIAVTGCKDKAKDANDAAAQLATLSAVTERDVAEVERGLPAGAAKLTALFAKGGDPAKDTAAVRSALRNVRRQVPDLNAAKSTFFALTDDKGVAIRNDLEEDVMAGMNLVTVFPALGNAKSGFVTTVGSFGGPPPKWGPDRDWIAAAPVKKEDGALGGLFVSGWTFRSFARHLSENLKSQLTEKAQKNGDNKLPLFYVAVFDKSGAYSAPLTPAVNEKTLADLDLVGKTSNGPAQGNVEITSRDFAWAAARAPKLGPEVGLALLWSNM